MASLTHLCEDVLQFLTLPLATNVSAKTGLAELQGTLILGNLQQFHAALLIRSMANDFADQVADEAGVLGLDLERQKGNNRND